MSLHPFDAALQLQPQADGSFLGATSPAWANMVGPFGGITAATVVHAIVGHAQCLGSPVALTLNYVAAIADGAFRLLLRIARTNRSTQHWVFEVQQTAVDGSVDCVLTGTAMTAQRRETWSAHDLAMPAVPAPETLPEARSPNMVEWFTRFDMRPVSGSLPQVWDGSEADLPAHEASLSQLWVRDRAGRALDFAACCHRRYFLPPHLAPPRHVDACGHRVHDRVFPRRQRPARPGWRRVCAGPGAWPGVSQWLF